MVTQPDPDHRPSGPRPNARPVLGSFVGMAGMACALFLVLASGLMAPAWAVAALTVVWLVLFVAGVRWFMTHPRRVAVLPVLMAAVWFATMLLGGAYLGWVA